MFYLYLLGKGVVEEGSLQNHLKMYLITASDGPND